MKALAIDSSGEVLCVSARNESDIVSCLYDIGMKQSETLVGAIDYVLCKASLEKAALDFASLCGGPGSFTSLRLSFAALKAINLAWGTPVYAVPTLEAIAHPYLGLNGIVIPVLDARKGRFYAAVYKDGVKVLQDGDYTIGKILQAASDDNTVFVVGSGAMLFKEKAAESGTSNLAMLPSVPVTLSLFDIAAEQIKRGAAPMKDFDGPLYLRPCDAQMHLDRDAAKA